VVPARPSRSAVARPIPLDAPVTMTTGMAPLSRKTAPPIRRRRFWGSTYRLLWYASTMWLGMRPRSETSYPFLFAHSRIAWFWSRLARPVLVAAQRGLYTADEWREWLAKVALPAPLASWDAAFTSRAGLARRHNVNAFFNVLYVNAQESGNENIRALIPGLQSAMKSLR